MWYWTFAWILTLITVIGNGLVVYLVLRIRRLHTTANWPVLSLAVADFFVGLGYFPLLLAFNVNTLGSPPVRNNTFFLISRTFLFASATNLCVMIVDRYIAIVNPLKYLFCMTTRVTVLAVAAAWLAPVLLFTVPFAMKVSSNFLLLFRVAVFQFVPVIVFFYVTARVFLIARRISHRTSKTFAQIRFNHPSEGVHPKVKQYMQTTASAKMTVAIILFFIVCYVVENYKCVCSVFGVCRSTNALEQSSDLLFVINSAANPGAYAFFKKDLKTALQRLFTRKTKLQVVAPGYS